MDFSNFLFLQHEIGIIALFVVLFFCDVIGSKEKNWFYPVALLLFGLLTVWGFLPKQHGEAFGGMFVSTPLTSIMKNVLNIGTFLVFLQSYKWLSSEEVRGKRSEFFIITVITMLGMYLMISAGNFMMLYIGMEMASIPLASLVALNKWQEKSAEAGVKFIFLSALASAVTLFGVSFLYGSAGTLYFSDMAGNLFSSALSIVGLVFFFAGLGFKLSLVPFHLWTADVYQGAPTTVTAYLSVISKGAAAFALMFVMMKVFGNMLAEWQGILWVLIIVTITLGNLFALRQTDIKRFFAFSSISQAGYIVLGIIANNELGMTAIVFYVLIYIFSNLGAFSVISAVEQGNGGDTSIKAFNGLSKSNPKWAFLMMLAVFSLGGIPIFAGFFSKIFIFMAAAKSGFWVLVFLALVNTVISLYYYLTIVKAMYIREREEGSVERVKADVYARICMVACFAGIIVIGLISGIYQWINNAAIAM